MNNNNKVSERADPLTPHLGESKVTNVSSENDYHSFRITEMACISITELYIVVHKGFCADLSNYSYCLLVSPLEAKLIYHIFFC